MSRITSLSIVLLLVSLLPAQKNIPAHPDELQFRKLDYQPPKRSEYRHELKNGVIVYLAEDHSLPLVNVELRIRTGSYLDPEGKRGLLNMMANQMRAGGIKSMSAEEFDEELAFLAANVSSNIGNFSTTGQASANFLAKDLDRVMELFFEMLRFPRFEQERIDLFKSQVLQNLERRNDRTSSIMSREWDRLMRGDGFWTTKQVTRASIESITREDLIAQHDKYYHPSNFMFAISGDFDSERMMNLLEKYLSDWPDNGEKVPEVPKPNFVPQPGVYMVNKEDVNQGRVRLGHLGLKRGHPDEFAINLMNDILGGSGFTSRIVSRVRSDEGLAYSAWSRFAFSIYYEGVFSAGFQSKSPSCAQAADIIIEEIKRIQNEPVSEEELETSKNYAIEVLPRFFESARAIVSQFLSDEYTGRPMKY